MQNREKKKISSVDGYEQCDGEYSYFYYQDLDGDGNNEVMVYFPSGQISIYHEMNGEIQRNMKKW